MEFKFAVGGHENLLGTHENTLEFTKDSKLSKRGNCIIGVNADFNAEKLKEFIRANKHRKILVEITSGKEKDSFVCFLNELFKSEHEMVFRTSDFVSERTLGVKINKGSLELKRSLIDSIAKEGAVVVMKPIKHKCVIFDLDNTIGEFEHSKSAGDEAVAKAISKKFGYEERKVKEMLANIDYEFTVRGIENKNINMYDRNVWYHEYAKRNKINIPKTEIKKLVALYWKTINKNITLIAGAEELLKELKKKYILVLMTDSDGERKVKTDRIKKLKIEKYFDLIVTGNDTKTTKPDAGYYDYMKEELKKIKKGKEIEFEECISIGDKPPADHLAAKPLGITNLWVKYGRWKTVFKEKPAYVDFETKNLKEIGTLVKRLDS